MKEKLIESFINIFGEKENIRAFFAPGRVNLIGEHTDYNGGHVFPCALTIGTYAIVRKREDNVIRFYSENFQNLGVIEGNIDDLVWKEEADWTNYPLGVVWAFGEKGYRIESGFDMLLFGNIPNGSGLSSSASVELVTGIMLKNLYNFEKLTKIDLALFGQFSENNFNGVNCGIMDQFIIAMGKKDFAILLDTGDLSFEYASIKLKNEKIVIANSNKKRGLGESKYNQRREECEEALANLKEVLDITSLGELSEEEYENYKYLIKDNICKLRAKHAVYENQRTIKAVKALEQGNIVEFGKLMNASHISLRDDYEVTGKELDALVEASWKQTGVIGSRMTGAGFGGCTVSIVKTDSIDSFIENVGKEYSMVTEYKADFYVVDIGDGCREI